MPFVGLGVGRQRFSDSGGGFDSDYQAVLNYATTQGYTLPSSGQQTLQNQLLVDLKDAGIWSKLDTFAVFATDGDSDFALIDWKRLSDYTAINSPTFTTNKGFNSDGTSAYINTNFNLLNDGVNYQQNDAGLFTFLSEYLRRTNKGFYTTPTTSNYLTTRNDVSRFWTNGGSFVTVNFFNSNEQIFFTNRVDGSNINARVTEFITPQTNTGSLLTTSTAIPNEDLWLLARQQSGLLNYLNSECINGLFGLGSQLSTTEMQDVETIWYTNYFSNL